MKTFEQLLYNKPHDKELLSCTAQHYNQCQTDKTEKCRDTQVIEIEQ